MRNKEAVMVRGISMFINLFSGCFGCVSRIMYVLGSTVILNVELQSVFSTIP